MQTAHFKTYAEFKKFVATLQEGEVRPRMMGMLFMRKGQSLADKEIVPSLEYFDVRSGSDIHFILAGWTREDHEYKFSPVEFAQAVKAIEENSNWKYSGQVELILFTARPAGTTSSGDGVVNTTERHSAADLSRILHLSLTQLQGNKMFGSVDQFFEIVFRFARNYLEDDPVRDFATQELRVGTAKGFSEAILGLVPKELRHIVDYVGEARVENISKEHRPMIEIVSTKVETSKAYD